MGLHASPEAVMVPGRKTGRAVFGGAGESLRQREDRFYVQN